MKTIVIFSWFYLPFIGGAELFVKAITDRLGYRYRFVIVTARADRKLAAIDESERVSVVRVGLGNRSDKFMYPLFALKWALASGHVDLVHAIMVNASAVAAYLFSKMKRVPTLLTLQEGDTEDYAREYLRLLFPVYPRLHRTFDRIHAISRFLEQQAITYGADTETIRVIPNGVDTEVFRPGESDASAKLRTRLGLDGKRVVVSVSRLVPKNGLDTLVEAMPRLRREHPDVALVLVGTGLEKRHLESKADELGVSDAVVLVGEVPHEETADYLRLAHAFVRPSRSEGLGSAFLEAMASGVPVVATPVGGIPDFLDPEVTGLFCKPNDPESVAGAIGRLFTDHALSQNLRVGGLRLVQARYRWDQVADRIAAVYEELL